MGRQQLAFLQNEFGKTCGMQNQPAPVNPVHVPKKKAEDEGRDETEEEHRKSACRAWDCQGTVMFFGWFCFRCFHASKE